MMEQFRTVMLMLIAFSIGLLCQFISIPRAVNIPRKVTMTRNGVQRIPPPPKTILTAQVISETVFYAESFNSSFVYTPRYPVRTCDTNMTYIDFTSVFTIEQNARIKKCMSTHEHDHAIGRIERIYVPGLLYLSAGYELVPMCRSGALPPKITRAQFSILFSIGRKEELAGRALRWTIHSYLDHKSFLIEAGGHKGLDTGQFNTRYHPGIYIVLEPVPEFYSHLKEKFKASPNVIIYKFGVDVADGKFYIDGNRNDGANIFGNVKAKSDTLKAARIVNVSKFFEKLSVKSRKVDLITMNCEGCEFAILDVLLSTDYIHHFQNIQFQHHVIPRICYPVQRFCWYQELLQKTHKLKYQFKYIWESWSRIESSPSKH